MSDAPLAPSTEQQARVCPASHAGWLFTPIRKLIHNPDRMLAGLVKPGEVALDLGCGPGFFTLPMAQMVGPRGHVIAVDLQREMLQRLQARAQRAGLAERIVLTESTAESIGDVGPVDFALAFYMLHEVPDEARFLGEVRASLKDGGHLLLVEPRGHVSAAAFSRTVEVARAAGLKDIATPKIAFSRAVLFAAH